MNHAQSKAVKHSKNEKVQQELKEAKIKVDESTQKLAEAETELNQRKEELQKAETFK